MQEEALGATARARIRDLADLTGALWADFLHQLPLSSLGNEDAASAAERSAAGKKNQLKFYLITFSFLRIDMTYQMLEG